jgi:3-demethoxyubiquinol 3-hydroxylase
MMELPSHWQHLYSTFIRLVMFASRSCKVLQRHASFRTLTTAARTLPSSAYTSTSQARDPSTSGTPEDLTGTQRNALDAALRVDQAGEIAANYIYMGQLAVLRRDRVSGPLIQVSYTVQEDYEELEHISGHVGSREKTFGCHEQAAAATSCATDCVMGSSQGSWVWTRSCHCSHGQGSRNGVHRSSGDRHRRALRRVSSLYFFLHILRAQDVVFSQLKELDEIKTSHPSIPLLKQVITEFRDDELEHLDTAVLHHSQRAPAHALLSTVVGAGCKLAIELCKRV